MLSLNPRGTIIDVRFSAAFDGLRAYLVSKIPEFSNMVTRWVEPDGNIADGLAMLLPHSNHTEGGRITCNLNLWFYTVSQSADGIATTQVAVMEKVFNAIYGKGGPPPPTLKATVMETEYERNLLPSVNMGRARALIELILAFDDDGND